MEITATELERLEIAIDYMEDAITDFVGHANDAKTKIRWMYEVKRVHQLAMNEIRIIRERNIK